MEASWLEPESGCPVPATHIALTEATLHIAYMCEHYHMPRLFLTDLNASVQALRNITWKLQHEKSRIPDFARWYEEEQVAMRNDPLLVRFRDSRNTVVKQSGLEARSSFRSGLFRGRRMKLAVGLNLPLMTASADELARLRASSFAAHILGSDRSAIGEQLGVERTWIVEELGESEVVSLCTSVRNKLGDLVSRAHARSDSSFRCEPLLCDDYDRQRFQVLLETDINPSLSKKWGWDKAEKALRRWLKDRQ